MMILSHNPLLNDFCITVKIFVGIASPDDRQMDINLFLKGNETKTYSRGKGEGRALLGESHS